MNRSEQTGNVVFDGHDENDIGDLMQEILQTEIGKRFMRDYLTREQIDSYTEKIVVAIQENAKNPAEVEVEEAAKILDIMMESGEFTPKILPPELPSETPPEPVDDRPRDKNGKLLSQSQIEFGTMRRFLAENSMETVNRRRREDAKFAAFCVHNLKTEMQQGVGDAVVPLNERTREGKVGPNLQEFARLYIKEPLANLKPRNGFVTLDGEQISWADFAKLQAAAAAKGLI